MNEWTGTSLEISSASVIAIFWPVFQPLPETCCSFIRGSASRSEKWTPAPFTTKILSVLLQSRETLLNFLFCLCLFYFCLFESCLSLPPGSTHQPVYHLLISLGRSIFLLLVPSICMPFVRFGPLAVLTVCNRNQKVLDSLCAQ